MRWSLLLFGPELPPLLAFLDANNRGDAELLGGADAALRYARPAIEGNAPT